MCTNLFCDEKLNEMCTLFGFYCRILSHGVAVSLILASFAYREKAQVLSAYSLCTGVFILLLESSWCYFHNKCLMNRSTLRLDSYMLRCVLYILLSAGGILINHYVEPQKDLFVMNIILGCAGVLFGIAHAQRPASLYEYYFDEVETENKRKKENFNPEEGRPFFSESGSLAESD
jgi:TRAP-type C4-dicarboxylate transport system permease small subunit|tara:strand:+ start:81 stop:605 length:525 start_codon:yes stop_codon:yes gene_type:complete